MTIHRHGKPTAALSVQETADYLAISPATLRRLTQAGKIPHARIGRSIRYRVVDLGTYLEAQVVVAA